MCLSFLNPYGPNQHPFYLRFLLFFKHTHINTNYTYLICQYSFLPSSRSSTVCSEIYSHGLEEYFCKPSNHLTFQVDSGKDFEPADCIIFCGIYFCRLLSLRVVYEQISFCNLRVVDPDRNCSWCRSLTSVLRA